MGTYIRELEVMGDSMLLRNVRILFIMRQHSLWYQSWHFEEPITTNPTQLTVSTRLYRCHADDFEEVNLVNEDDDSSEPPAVEADQEDDQEVEEVRLPEAPEDEQYGTARCRCHCHSRPEKMYARRKHHCHSCSMKVTRFD